jgi:16S rRNA (guanine527-N7)-methyltransferase
LNAPTLSIEQALEEMKRRLARLLIEPSEAQIQQLRDYCSTLQKYNEHTNLVSKTDAESLVLGHIVDSWTLVPLMRAPASEVPSLVDIGSGAGFPGIILAIAIPELQVTLIESVGKKSRFLTETVQLLGFDSRVTVLNERAEDVASRSEYRNRFDFATARAVATIDVIAEMAVPMLKLQGLLLAQKSLKQVDDERPRTNISLPELGSMLRDIYALDREVLQRDSVVMVVEKTARSPGRYPRAAAQIKKHPLGEL